MIKGDGVRILGIDPGLNLTGYGCVDVHGNGTDPSLVEAGVFRLKAKAAMAFRLEQLYGDLCQVLDELNPEFMVVERLFSHYKHVRTGILMGHARGVILLAGQVKSIAIQELSATEVKRALTGHGHASKQQMQRAIMMQFGLREPPSPPDVADAIAIALCAARRANGRPRVQ